MMLPTASTRLHSCMLSSWRRSTGFLIALATATCTNGCTGSSSGGGGGATIDTDGAVVSCKDDPRVNTYTANLTRAGQRAVLTFTLVQSDPAPLGKGNN